MMQSTKISKRIATSVSGDAVTVLAFAGDISGTSQDEVLDAYHSLNGVPERILLDFTSVGYINSSGIAIVIQISLETAKKRFACDRHLRPELAL
jgi:anti-sigma B factor antagonist